jgi:multiple sugar transport system ATP-binding protein
MKITLDAAVASAVAKSDGADLTVGIRPQGLSLGGDGVPATVMVVEELGSETFVFVEMEHRGETRRVRVRVDAEYRVSRGDHTNVDVVGPVHLFGADGLRFKTAAEMED